MIVPKIMPKKQTQRPEKSCGRWSKDKWRTDIVISNVCSNLHWPFYCEAAAVLIIFKIVPRK